MPALPIRAYTDKLSYEAGEQISVHVSSTVGPVSIGLTRLLNCHSHETDLDFDVEWSAAGTYPAHEQQTLVGSCAHATISPARVTTPSEVTVGAFIWSGGFTGAEAEAIISTVSPDAGPALLLMVDAGHIVFTGVDDGEQLWSVRSSAPVRDRTWYFVAGTITDGEAGVVVEPLDHLYGQSTRDAVAVSTTPVTLRGLVVGASRVSQIERIGRAARGLSENSLNGKVERPFVAAAAITESEISRLLRYESPVTVFGDALVGAWDFSPTDRDQLDEARSLINGEPAAVLVNVPTLGVTGTQFDGSVLNFAHAPSHYGAAHFHSTDLYDAGWAPAVAADLPSELPSGVYGVVVEADGHRDTVPITVVPGPDTTQKKIAIVLPTFTYLAYANEHLFELLDPTAMTDRPIHLADEDLARPGDQSFGLSLYDMHRDGSGTIMSSARRQIVNMRRGYESWIAEGYRGFSADMYLVEWAHRRGFEFDVITDMEIHARGKEYLDAYEVLISGAHPEYTTQKMFDALYAYRDQGGRIMYLGGNGWYWVTGVYDEDPLLIEIRRGHAGIRCWESYPGEVNLISTGEPGGLWRHRGMAPQRFAGVGMAAQGWSKSAGYRLAEELDPEGPSSWILAGVDENPIGEYGYVMNGAAGDEIDRADVALGTPPGATTIASSFGHPNYYQRAIEELPMTMEGHAGGQNDPEIHADIVYFATPGGGEVFSVGSMAWSGSLLWNKSDNGVSRITENVVRRFARLD